MLETLGEGGFSKVKLGIDTVTKEKVALKMLKKDKLSLSSSTRKQVEREIAAMSKIAHPNVIRLREVDWSAQYEKKNGKKRDIILVVLELATGNTATQRVCDA
jgi:serine/threonine protein kinase